LTAEPASASASIGSVTASILQDHGHGKISRRRLPERDQNTIVIALSLCLPKNYTAKPTRRARPAQLGADNGLQRI
jgi:hypothetical protein